jgi:cytochrome c oxidase subunit 4
MAVHAAPHSGAAHKTHHPSARFYLLIFLILAIVTVAEVFVAQEPFLTIFTDMGLPGRALIPLLVLAASKFFMIAAFYMHLKQDSRLFTMFFIIGLILALGMWGSFMGLFTAHYREPFDQVAWRESLAKESGGAGATTGAPAAGGH